LHSGGFIRNCGIISRVGGISKRYVVWSSQRPTPGFGAGAGTFGVVHIGMVGGPDPTGTTAVDTGDRVTGAVIDCVTIAGFWDFMRHTRYAAAPVKPKISISSVFITCSLSLNHLKISGISS
jgi:hypothetical protein